jgi:hypothetical protein
LYRDVATLVITGSVMVGGTVYPVETKIDVPDPVPAKTPEEQEEKHA